MLNVLIYSLGTWRIAHFL